MYHMYGLEKGYILKVLIQEWYKGKALFKIMGMRDRHAKSRA